MRIAILDPFSGIAGDMTLGALVDVGLDPEWLRALPARSGSTDVSVRHPRSACAARSSCKKVDFDIPPQPHGRHIREIRELVARAAAPPRCASAPTRAFTAIAEPRARSTAWRRSTCTCTKSAPSTRFSTSSASIWGFELLGVERVYCGPIALGDGTVQAAHGVLPVPAPATLKLLEGHPVRPGPEGPGELVTPTGAALVRVLSSGPPPREYVPLRSGFGAGTKDFRGPRERAAHHSRAMLGDRRRRRGRLVRARRATSMT